MSDFGIVLFHTNSAVMQAEALLLRANFKIKLVPTPAQPFERLRGGAALRLGEKPGCSPLVELSAH